MIDAKEARKLQGNAQKKIREAEEKVFEKLLPGIENDILVKAGLGENSVKCDITDIPRDTVAALRNKLSDQGYSTTIYKNTLSISWFPVLERKED
jgi:hypothetical protein